MFELFLYRNTNRELEFRFALGKHNLNVDTMLGFAELILRGIYCYKLDGKVVARFKGGLVSLPNRGYVSALGEPFEKMYKVFSFGGRVLDVGGYLGETAFLFKKWGADEVIVYEPEPVFAQHARKTMLLNSVKGVVHELYVNCSSSPNSISWTEVLKEKIDIAKVDCEGCENGLLRLPNDYIRKISKWVIECHDLQTLRRLGEKFGEAGFIVTFKPYIRQANYSILTHEMVFHPKTETPKRFLSTTVTTYLMIARLSERWK